MSSPHNILPLAQIRYRREIIERTQRVHQHSSTKGIPNIPLYERINDIISQRQLTLLSLDTHTTLTASLNTRGVDTTVFHLPPLDTSVLEGLSLYAEAVCRKGEPPYDIQDSLTAFAGLLDEELMKEFVSKSTEVLESDTDSGIVRDSYVVEGITTQATEGRDLYVPVDKALALFGKSDWKDLSINLHVPSFSINYHQAVGK